MQSKPIIARLLGAAPTTTALLALVGLCNGCFYVGLDIEELRTRIERSTLTVEASNSALIGTEVTAANTFDFDLSEEVQSGLLDWVEHADVTALRLLPKAEVEDLSFVRGVEIQLVAPDTDLPQVTAARYLNQESSTAADGGLDLAVEEAVNYRDYLTRPVRFHVELTFEYPGKAWSFDVDLAIELGLGHKGDLL